MFKTNKELAAIFRKMADIYHLRDDANHFRTLTYEKAAGVLDNFEEDIRDNRIHKIRYHHVQGSIRSRKLVGKRIATLQE